MRVSRRQPGRLPECHETSYPTLAGSGAATGTVLSVTADQFQLYETIWASGERAGVTGREKANLWRQDAEAAEAFTQHSDGGSPPAGATQEGAAVAAPQRQDS